MTKIKNLLFLLAVVLLILASLKTLFFAPPNNQNIVEFTESQSTTDTVFLVSKDTVIFNNTRTQLKTQTIKEYYIEKSNADTAKTITDLQMKTDSAGLKNAVLVKSSNQVIKNKDGRFTLNTVYSGEIYANELHYDLAIPQITNTVTTTTVKVFKEPTNAFYLGADARIATNPTIIPNLTYIRNGTHLIRYGYGLDRSHNIGYAFRLKRKK